MFNDESVIIKMSQNISIQDTEWATKGRHLQIQNVVKMVLS